jgi:hypothetical protein
VLGFAAAGLVLFYLSYRYMLLYTTQPKLDTKGKCYTLALQQIITGVYIAELSLIGLFGLRGATGPSIMLAILFIVTTIYNVLMNRYFSPLEKFLPADIDSDTDTEATDTSEQTPLLSYAEEGRGQPSHLQHVSQIPQSAAHHLSQLPQTTTRHVLHQQLTTSHQAVRRWLTSSPDFSSLFVPQYSDQQLHNAYLNPALTSSTPVIWLPRDGMGVSQNEVSECEGLGLEATDRGAWLDEKGRVRWSEGNFEEVPVFKEGVRW